MSQENVSSPIVLSKEQTIRLYGLLLYLKEVSGISQAVQEVSTFKEMLNKLNILAKRIAEKGDVPGLLVQVTTLLQEKISTAQYLIEKGDNRLRDITSILNGKSVEGWGCKDPFQNPMIGQPKHFMSLILDGKPIDFERMKLQLAAVEYIHMMEHSNASPEEIKEAYRKIMSGELVLTSRY